MPVAARKRTAAKPRARAQAKPGRGRAAPRAAAQAGRIEIAKVAGLSPRYAMLAAAAVLIVATGAVLGTGGRGQSLADAVVGSIDKAFGAAGFRLAAVRIQGASPMASAEILTKTGLYKDQPILGLNLEAMRQQVLEVGWVEEARVVRLMPDTLVIAVKERKPLAVWQHNGRSVVVDRMGRVIPKADPGRFSGLPLIVGAGANEHADEILPAVNARPRLSGRLEALVRVDDRRWDLRLKDGSLVQLPAVDEEAALIQLEQLDQRTRILELGFERIDLRDPNVVAVRPRDGLLPGQSVAGGAFKG
ncbi:MAG: cell division protein FtsQ/DivIB [Phenylobacterium sp.]